MDSFALFTKRRIVVVFTLLFFFVTFSQVSAQVNINSKTTEGDNEWYELSDPEFSYETGELVIPTGTVIATPAPTTTTDGNQNTGSGPINIIKQTFSSIESTLVENSGTPVFFREVVKTLGLPAVSTLSISLAFLPALLSLIPLILSPQLLLLLLGVIFGEQKNVWGIISDQKTKKPIPFAVVRLFEKRSTAQISQKVSDLEGRYGFVLSTGRYRVEVSQSGYQTYKQDIVIKDEEELFAEDIELAVSTEKSPGKVFQNFFAWLKKFSFKYSIYFAGVGFVFSIISLVLQANTLNAFIFLFYLGLILLYIYIKFIKNNRTWGVIVASDSGLRVAGATIRLFDPKNSLADTQLSDSKGRFGFLVDPGKYSLLVKAPGYNFPSVNQDDYKRTAGNKDLLEVNIKKPRWLNMVIKLDPESGSARSNNDSIISKPAAGDKLLTPFGE